MSRRTRGHPAAQPASRPLQAFAFVMIGLLLAALVGMIFGRDNVVTPAWLHTLTWLVVFPALLVGCLALFSFGQPAQRTPRGLFGLVPLALPAAAMLAYLPVLILGALADVANRRPFSEPAILVRHDGGGIRRGCPQLVTIRRGAGDNMKLCGSKVAMDSDIAPGSPVRLVGRESILGIAIDAIRKQ